jgi:hypothetical protein
VRATEEIQAKRSELLLALEDVKQVRKELETEEHTDMDYLETTIDDQIRLEGYIEALNWVLGTVDAL